MSTGRSSTPENNVGHGVLAGKGKARVRKRGHCLLNQIKAQNILPTSTTLRFIPDEALDRLICEKAVVEALQQQKFNANDVSELKSFVCNKARRLFAILVWSSSEKQIEQFFQHKFGDEKLPIDVNIKEDTDSVDAVVFKMGKLKVDEHPFDLEPWTDRNIEHFCETQWAFLSPVFRENQFRYHFHERVHMPFVEEEPIVHKESHFSHVEQWRIHRDHLQTSNFIVSFNPSLGELVFFTKLFSLLRYDTLTKYMQDISDKFNDHPCVAIKELKRLSSKDEHEFETMAEAEARALEMIRNLNHPHLIKAIAYYTKGRKHFIMFPWARHGNLRDLWKKDPRQLDRPYLRWAFTQLRGLADAIERLHHFDEEKSWHHGDLKPENILCFDDVEKPEFGKDNCYVLVIADVGLAKDHALATQFRKGATSTKSGTIMYEPPEAELHPEKPRTRRYDIWSLGCIYLEFIIWLLYKVKGLDRFREEIGSLGNDTRFYVTEEVKNMRKKTARLNAAVQKWIDWIKKDPRCPPNTALRSLLELVVTRLLVADVTETPILNRTWSLIHEGDAKERSDPSTPVSPTIVRTSTNSTKFETSNDSFPQSRATAKEIIESMEKILTDATSPINRRIEWIQWEAKPQGEPRNFGNHLDTSGAGATVRKNFKDHQSEYRFTPLDDSWEYTPDADTARLVFADPSVRAGLPRRNNPPSLCQRCSGLKLWMPRSSFSDDLRSLKARVSYCHLCRLLVRHTSGCVNEDDSEIQFSTVGSSLICNDRRKNPILSLYNTPSPGSLGLEFASSEIQTGIPKLPEPGSSTHIRIITEWIRNCDQTHRCLPKGDTFLPTRVLDIGNHDSLSIRLSCSTQGQTRPGKYLALSHRWGSPGEYRSVLTRKSNIEEFKKSIDMFSLPKTFRDAVRVTRALGIQYLWIDSLCIIQDDAQDWDTESKLMEQVFSSAYATLAASCAEGTDAGFLKPRADRECVTMTKDDGSQFYICDAIDNFSRDVDQGKLNRRGWVLQERALSRRSIYFTEAQTYWECGGGVRCETLTKMKNRKASFLGDANFPHSVEDYVKGMRIKLFQGLYEKYSNLDLTFDADRPVAIKGLEKRLIQTLKTSGGYGVFGCYLHRCLLWQRSGENLKRIQSFRAEDIPSWSWMACKGGIKYMDVPFGKVSWAEELGSPFQERNQEDPEYDEARIAPLEIKAHVWNIIDLRDDDDVVLDEPARAIAHPLQCVVVGSDKETKSDQSGMNYVLIVAPVGEADVGHYERMGVGILDKGRLARVVSASTVPTWIHIR